MEEETGNARGIMLESSHKRMDLVRDILSRIWKLSRMYRELQRMVEVFVRIVFRGIRREEKYFNFLLVFLQPGFNKLAMMNLQVIQYQEHLPLRRADKALHKLDQPPLIHGVLIDHETHIALVADCRKHIDPFPLCFHRQNRRLSFGSEAPLHHFAAAHASLIRPIYDGILCFCTT